MAVKTSNTKANISDRRKGVDRNNFLLAQDLSWLRVGKLEVDEYIIPSATGGTSLVIRNEDGGATANMLDFRTVSATPADGDEMRLRFFSQDDTGVSVEAGRIAFVTNDVTAATMDSSFEISVMSAGVLTRVLDVNSSAAGTVTSTYESGDIVLNDNVSLQLGTAGAESDLSSNGTNSIWTLSSGALNITGTGSLTGDRVLISAGAGILTTTGDVLSLTANSATTSTGLLRASGTGLTDGWVSQLTGGGANATALGGVLDIVAGLSTLGSAVRVVSTGAATSTTVGHLLQLQDDSNALGIGIFATLDGITSGEGFLITHAGSAIIDGGSLFRLTDSGINTGGTTNAATFDIQSSGQLAGVVAGIDSIVTTGAALEVSTSGIYTGSVGVVDINAAAATTGDIVVIGGTGLTEGSALRINATTATLTTGFYIECNDGAASDFTVGDDGAVTIAGGAGTTALGITAGNIVITTGSINLTAGNGSITRADAGAALTLSRTEDVASVQVAVFEGNRATPADNDNAYISFQLSDSAGNQDESARILWRATTVAEGGTQDSDVVFSTVFNGVLTDMLTLDGSVSELVPNVVINSGAAITGTVLTGNTSVSTPTLTAAAGQTLTATSLTFSQSVPTVGTGFDGALVDVWAPFGRHGAAGPYINEFIFDLTNLVNSTTANDIIGETATANCHFGQITAAIHGTVQAIEIVCLETPTGGDPDINVYSAVEATGTENDLITDLTETLLLDRGASWANGDVRGTTGVPAANEYLYLAVGSAGGAPGTYTAGKFKVRIYGT